MLGKCVKTEVSVKFVRNWYEFRTNLCEFPPICLFHRCNVASTLPLLQVVPHTLCLVFRCPSTRGPQRCGNTPAGGSPRIVACRCPLRTASGPAAPGMDGTRARPQMSAARPPRARDALRGGAARQARVWGVGRGPKAGDHPHAIARGVGHRPPRPPPWPGSPLPLGSPILPGSRGCRPCPMGGTGIFLPCGTWPWRPTRCRPISATPSHAPL